MRPGGCVARQQRFTHEEGKRPAEPAELKTSRIAPAPDHDELRGLDRAAGHKTLRAGAPHSASMVGRRWSPISRDTSGQPVVQISARVYSGPNVFETKFGVTYGGDRRIALHPASIESGDSELFTVAVPPEWTVHLDGSPVEPSKLVPGMTFAQEMFERVLRLRPGAEIRVWDELAVPGTRSRSSSDPVSAQSEMRCIPPRLCTRTRTDVRDPSVGLRQWAVGPGGAMPPEGLVRDRARQLLRDSANHQEAHPARRPSRRRPRLPVRPLGR
jgi:hypothetical protein